MILWSVLFAFIINHYTEVVENGLPHIQVHFVLDTINHTRMGNIAFIPPSSSKIEISCHSNYETQWIFHSLQQGADIVSDSQRIEADVEIVENSRTERDKNTTHQFSNTLFFETGIKESNIGFYMCRSILRGEIQSSVFLYSSDGSVPTIDVTELEIKENTDEIHDLHPGKLAVFQSLRQKRSPNNVYIIVLGQFASGKSTTINFLLKQFITGSPPQPTNTIMEYGMAVAVQPLGLQNTKLNIIDTPGLADPRGFDYDAKFILTLDTFLKQHQELQRTIPNVVLIFARYDDQRIGTENSNFIKMLKGIEYIRRNNEIIFNYGRKYPNVIFVLTHFMNAKKEQRENVTARLQFFKQIINKYTQLSEPILFTVAENDAEDRHLPSVNGYYRLTNGDLYPQNLIYSMNEVVAMNGDALGEALLHQTFVQPENLEQTSQNNCSMLELDTEEIKSLKTAMNDIPKRESWADSENKKCAQYNSTRWNEFPYVMVHHSEKEKRKMLLGACANHPGLLFSQYIQKKKTNPIGMNILVLGLEGSGKTSTISILLNKTMDTLQAESNEIVEYELAVPLKTRRIANTHIRIIDTPGFQNSISITDDFRLLSTLSTFLENHDYLSQYIPNVVLVTTKLNVKISYFRKMLKALDYIKNKIVNPLYSNIIFIVTHAESIRSSNGNDNQTAVLIQNKMEEFKRAIKGSSLPSPVHIVLAENRPWKNSDAVVDRSNTFRYNYFLLNGEKYPAGLFTKMSSFSGGSILREYYLEHPRAFLPKVLRTFPLLDMQSVVKYIISNPIFETHFANTRVSKLLLQAFKTVPENLKPLYPETLWYIQRALFMEGIREEARVKFSSEADNLKFCRENIKNELQFYLVKMALMNFTCPAFNFTTILVGYGYNLVSDSELSHTPFQNSDFSQWTSIGYLMPSQCLNLSVIQAYPLVFSNFIFFKSFQDYVKLRLKNLNIKVFDNIIEISPSHSIPIEKFVGKLKPGYNYYRNHTDGFSRDSTLLIEYRLFQIAVNTNIPLCAALIQKSNSVYVDYDGADLYYATDNSTLPVFGTHLVKSAFGGGAIEITFPFSENTTFDSFINNSTWSPYPEYIVNKIILDSIPHRIKFHGGDQRFVVTEFAGLDFDFAHEVIRNWTSTLFHKPTLLHTNLELMQLLE